jgi:hypothetical protein
MVILPTHDLTEHVHPSRQWQPSVGWGILPTQPSVGRVDRRGMTTSTTTGTCNWSAVLRVLAPGPLALCMRAFIDPSGWQAMRTRRYVAQSQAEEEVVAPRARQ